MRARWRRVLLRGSKCALMIAVLALVAPNPAVRNFFVAARAKAKMDVVSIHDAVGTYIVANDGRVPESLEVLVTPDENGRTILKNLTSVPRDPWGNPYGYEPPSESRGYRVFTLGRDCKPGGAGDDADIDNFSIEVR
jgi:general secretion pathway protein G